MHVFHSKRRWMIFPATLFLLFVFGCAKEDGIESYNIPKPIPFEYPANVRLLAVIVEQPPYQWFIKLSGPKELIDPHEKGFMEIVNSLQFTGKDDPPATWTLPKGWEQDVAGNGKELMTSIFPNGKGKQPRMTMSRFGKISGVVENINRWCRIDLGRPSIRESDLEKWTKPIEVSKRTGIYVDMTGPGARKGKGSGMGGMPMVGGGMPGGPRKGLIKYDKPEGWEETGQRGFMDTLVVTSFRINEQGQTAKVDLTVQQGGMKDTLLKNVNRWRMQVGLKDLTQAELDQNPPREFLIDGQPAKYFDVDGPKQRQIMVTLTHRGLTWYLKLIGVKEVVEKNKTKFETLLKSVKFTGGSDE